MDQYGSPYIAPAVVGTHGLDVRRDDLVLRSCGTSRVRVISRSPDWNSPFFRGAHVRVPGAVNPNVSTVHTRRHVFVNKASDGYTHRYAIEVRG